MNSNEFIYWLKGYLDGAGVVIDMELIKRKLGEVATSTVTIGSHYKVPHGVTWTDYTDFFPPQTISTTDIKIK